MSSKMSLSVLAPIFNKWLRCFTSLLLTLAILAMRTIRVSLISFEILPMRVNLEILLILPRLKRMSKGITERRSIMNQPVR